jgi:hypothetical protein
MAASAGVVATFGAGVAGGVSACAVISAADGGDGMATDAAGKAVDGVDDAGFGPAVVVFAGESGPVVGVRGETVADGAAPVVPVVARSGVAAGGGDCVGCVGATLPAGAPANGMLGRTNGPCDTPVGWLTSTRAAVRGDAAGDACAVAPADPTLRPLALPRGNMMELA